MRELKYTTSSSARDKYYINGPGKELGYNAGLLWPNLRFGTYEDAERSACIANIAYEQGYLQAQVDIRKAIGA